MLRLSVAALHREYSSIQPARRSAAASHSRESVCCVNNYVPGNAALRSFDLLDLYQSIDTHGANLANGVLPLVLPVLILGFGILVSLWPFHTWAPLGYGSAPTATAMMHAGVIKKFGLYGLIRIVLRHRMPMFLQFESIFLLRLRMMLKCLLTLLLN